MSHPILLVEDDLKLAEIARVYLEQAGFMVIHTESGVSALALAKTENPVLRFAAPGKPAFPSDQRRFRCHAL